MKSADVLAQSEIDCVVAYMRMGMHDRVSARKERAQAKSPHWGDNRELVTGKFEKNEFVARVMGHLADQYDGPIGYDPPTWGFPKVGDKVNKLQPLARIFRKSPLGTAAHVYEHGIRDGEMSDVDPQEARGIHRREVGNSDTPSSGGRSQGEPKR